MPLQKSSGHCMRQNALARPSACPLWAPFVPLIRSVRCRNWLLLVSPLCYGVVTGHLLRMYKNPPDL